MSGLGPWEDSSSILNYNFLIFKWKSLYIFLPLLQGCTEEKIKYAEISCHLGRLL